MEVQLRQWEEVALSRALFQRHWNGLLGELIELDKHLSGLMQACLI